MTQTEFFKLLYNLYGPVTRARGCFLYTKKGVRITDLFQENGRAILGWEGGSSFTHFKNVLSRSQVGSFITEEQKSPCRLARAVDELTESDRCSFIFSDKMSALKAALAISSEGTSFYKPWAENQNCSAVDSLIIIPPLPWTDSIFILAVKTKLIPENVQPAAKTGTFLPGSIKLPFALETAVTRSLYNLINELKIRQEKDWFIYDSVISKYWERKGPYLFPKVPQEKYDDFVLHCLKCGIAVNPEFGGNSIIPFGADKGVFTKLKNSPFEF